MKYIYSEMTLSEIEELITKKPIVILPVGTMEQHSLHLPVGTDSYLADNVSAEAAKKVCGEVPVAVLPVFDYGSTTTSRDFPGALTIKPSILIEALRDLLISISQCGFSSTVLVNGHGGNNYIHPAVYEAIRHGLKSRLFLVSPFAFDAQSIIANEVKNQGNVGHACQIETSQLLDIDPELVYKDEMQEGELFSHMVCKYEFIRDASLGVSFVPNRHEHMKKGGRGDPRLSSIERGRELNRLRVDGLADALVEIHRSVKMCEV